jgi:3-dehydroquinate synthase
MEAIDRHPTLRKTSASGAPTSRRANKKNVPASIVPALRTALVRDARLYEYLMTNAGALRRQQPSAIHYLARRCMQWQELEVRDGEACRDFACRTAAQLERIAPNLAHDEATTFAIVVDVAYSYLAGALPIADLERTVSLVNALGFSLFTPELYALSADTSRRSKTSRASSTILLLKGIGQGTEAQLIDTSLFDHAVRLIDSWGGEAVHWAGIANERK